MGISQVIWRNTSAEEVQAAFPDATVEAEDIIDGSTGGVKFTVVLMAGVPMDDLEALQAALPNAELSGTVTSE